MRLREGEYATLPTAVVRLEFRRRTGEGIPRAEARALLSGEPRQPGEREGAAEQERERAAEPGASGAEPGLAVDVLTVDLAALDAGTDRVRVLVRAEGGSFAAIPGLALRVAVPAAVPGAGPPDAAPPEAEPPAAGPPAAGPAAAGPAEIARFDWAGADGGTYVLGECRRDGAGWRFTALAEPAGPAGQGAAARGAAGEGAAGKAAPVAVTLTAAAPAVSLARQGGGSGVLTVHPEWWAAPGAWEESDSIGLDLCALFELSDGSKGVVQSLGGAYGALDRPPFLLLGSDERTGERITVDLGRTAHFRRLLVFVSVYEEGRSFAGLRGAVTLRPEYGAEVDFLLDTCEVPSTVCALALFTRDGADLVVRREARFLAPHPGVSPQRTVDYAYGWGLAWRPDPNEAGSFGG